MKKTYSDFLIVTDLDGTFFADKAALVPRNLEAVHSFMDRGGTFTYATGRDSWIMPYIFPDAADHVNAPAIMCGGGYLYDFSKGVAIDGVEMDHREACVVIEAIFSRFPGTGLRIGSSSGYLSPFVTPAMEPLYRKIPLFEVGSPESFADRKWYKLVFVPPEEIAKDVYAFAATLPTETLHLTTSSPRLVEFFPKASGKANGLRKLRRLVGEKTVISVGDYLNDLDILEAADLAACPENAADEVKKICPVRLCDHNEGAIADLIERLPSLF